MMTPLGWAAGRASRQRGPNSSSGHGAKRRARMAHERPLERRGCTSTLAAGRSSRSLAASSRASVGSAG
eukprot:scaffold297721_cov17-Tisochrysis_lutea.AAC.1